MADLTGVFGTGILRDAVAGALDGRVVELADPSAAGVSMLVSVTDAWDTSDHDGVRKAARQHGIPWLPVRTELTHAVIGPREQPEVSGCVRCAEIRHHRIQPDQAHRDAVWQRHSDRLASRPAARLTGLAAQLVAAVVADTVADGTATAPRTWRARLRVDLTDLTVTRHPFLPEPTCPVCGGLPDDSRQAARIALSPRPAHRPGSHRVRALIDELPALVSRYVDDQVGVVHSFREGRSGALVLAEAPVGLRAGGSESGFGRSSSAPTGRLTALLEALERFGSAPGGRRTSVLAPYREVADEALDPRTLGLHSQDQYALPGFHYRPFDPDRPYRWVWGWSFAREQPILVPELYGYYGTPHDDIGGHGVVYEISNGCALGGCLEEAILYGLLEVAERDAFLLTWYARLPAPRIDLPAGDRPLSLLAASIAAVEGYRVELFDITTEHGMPCVWAMGVNPTPDDGRAALVCAAGSHLLPERAARNALVELSSNLSMIRDAYSGPEAAVRARAMAADSDLVQTMDDHSLLYADRSAAARLDFLRHSGAVRPLAEVGSPEPGGFGSDDLRENLLEAVARYARHGMDVVVVDQTAAEHGASDLACVKVIVPGTLPMTFGHRHRRTVGLPRLHQVPQLLGYTDRSLPPEEVNPHPHPFP